MDPLIAYALGRLHATLIDTTTAVEGPIVRTVTEDTNLPHLVLTYLGEDFRLTLDRLERTF